MSLSIKMRWKHYIEKDLTIYVYRRLATNGGVNLVQFLNDLKTIKVDALLIHDFESLGVAFRLTASASNEYFKITFKTIHDKHLFLILGKVKLCKYQSVNGNKLYRYVI